MDSLQRVYCSDYLWVQPLGVNEQQNITMYSYLTGADKKKITNENAEEFHFLVPPEGGPAKVLTGLTLEMSAP